MAGIVIVGGGIAGLATALLLGRQGRDAVVCERDGAVLALIASPRALKEG